MRRSYAPVNVLLLATLLALTGIGFVIFLSASIGLVARDTGADFKSVVFTQTIFGLLPGLLGMYVLSRIPHKKLRIWSLYLLAFSILLSFAVFIPGLGFAHGGAQRWISLGSHTFQPSELLKIAVIIYLAAWFAMVGQKASTFRSGALPFLVVIGITGAVLFSQPDIDTFMVLFASGLAMYIAAGAKIRHVILILLLCTLLTGVLTLVFPYVKQRMQTFINPTADSLGSGYQIQQSLIAVGSGGFFGKGFGKSTQKFNYLPEPIGDSVYAVASEEFGFIGSVGLLFFFFLLGHQGLRVASRARDLFGRYLAVGIVMMFLSQAFINIGAMLGILPLSGITLPFISHGGTALLFTLTEAGILLSISRSARE